MQNGMLLAAVDLGSNSFRLEIGRFEHGRIQRTEYLKETVRQGSGLDESRNLTPEAMRRGLECLSRFGERLAGFQPRQVRAVATQTLREARNREVFLADAHRALGFPIDVISGREEARLIYQGVARLLPQSSERRLVADIGGRSTELILGRGFRAEAVESFRVGSVDCSMRHFADGQFTDTAFEQASVAVKAVLDEAVGVYSRGAWDVAYGSSGTIGAVGDVLTAARAAGQRPGDDADAITLADLRWIREQLVAARSADRLRLGGLKEERRAVIGGGLVTLLSLFELLRIDRMHAAQGALRHGVLYDLIAREQDDTDLRGATIAALGKTFNVDAEQGARVARVAAGFLGQIAGSLDGDAARLGRKLGWAAQLHEVGAVISHSDYHRHGAYILDHADAPGFSQPELHRLGQLVLGHRGKLRKLGADLSDQDFVRQLLCLRLAVVLCHARRDPDVRDLALAERAGAFSLKLPVAWAQAWPQSAHLLREESAAWAKADRRFDVGG